MRGASRLFSVLATAVMPLAHADEAQPCESAAVEAVAGWVGVQGKLAPWDAQRDGIIVANACKAMPNASGTTIAVIAFDVNRVSPGVDDGRKEQVVALVEDGKVIAGNRSTVEEDALTQIGRYRIDTARYQLAADVRAFGVVFDSAARGPSCPDAAAEHELTLWIREGKHLRPVFGTNLYGWVAADDFSCGSGIEGARSESANMTIAVESQSSHGLANLALTTHIEQTQLKAGEYVNTGKRTVRAVLKYDGESYGFDMFRDFWYPPK